MASSNWHAIAITKEDRLYYRTFKLLLLLTAMSSFASAGFIGRLPSKSSRTTTINPGGVVLHRRWSRWGNRSGSTLYHPVRGGAYTLTSPTRLFDATAISTAANPLLWQSMGIFTGTNVLGLAISLFTGSHLHLDLLGTGAFAVAALFPLMTAATAATALRFKLSCGAVALWGIKLAGFLFFRATKMKHDARLDETLSTTAGAVGFWVISATWGILCSLPHTLAGATAAQASGTLPTTVLGLTVYTVGLVFETVADLQKWNFKAENPGKFCDVGLWSISQHPNYFGNLLIWCGILLLNGPALVELPENRGFFSTLWGCRNLFFASLSPAFMWFLFHGQASGSITNSVALALKKYGDDPNFVKYIETVPLIIPKLSKGK